jgi:hypothetical protein
MSDLPFDVASPISNGGRGFSKEFIESIGGQEVDQSTLNATDAGVQPRFVHIASLPIVTSLKVDAIFTEEPPSKKGKAKKEAVPEEEPFNEFACFYINEASDPNSHDYAVGVHGYVSSQLVAKRGYGLKKIIPTPQGYSDTSTDPLKVIAEVIDIRIPLYKESDRLTVGNLLAAGMNATLQLVAQMEDIPKSIHLMLPRKNLVAFFTKGYIKAVENDYKDAKGNPIPFKEGLIEYLRLSEVLTGKGSTVTLGHVAADAPMGFHESLANANDGLMASVKCHSGEAESHCLISAPEGYWNHEHGRHPLLGKSRMVFRMQGGEPVWGEHVYLMDFEPTSKKKEQLHKLEIEVGQLLPSASYCVAKIANLDPIIHEIADEHAKYLDTKVGRMAVMFLDAVFKPGAHSVMTKVGARFLHSRTVVTDLVDSYGSMFTHDLNPVRRADRAWDTYLEMGGLVKEFLSTLEPTNPDVTAFQHVAGPYVATRITDSFFSAIEGAKGKVEYKPSKLVETPATSVRVKGFYLDEALTMQQSEVNLSIGVDMPKRNVIAGLASEAAQAYILLRQDTAFTVRHFVVVTNGDEYGIWTAPFANRTFVKK